VPTFEIAVSAIVSCIAAREPSQPRPGSARRGLLSAALLATATVAGCAGTPSNQNEPNPPPEAQQPQQAIQPPPDVIRLPQASPQTPAPEEADSYLEHLFADRRLDPIRDKVPLLLRADAVTASHLSNQEKPTEQERRAIAVWESVRERAQQYQQEQRGPPSLLLVRVRQQVTRAILQLYDGELTYGEFAARIRQMDEDYQEAAARH